jgi:hypothetical protein
VPVVPEEAALADRRGLLREIAFRQERIEQLTAELEREREASKAEHEGLHRELGELRQQLGVLQEQVKSVRDKTLLELYEQGRIKPKEE